MNRNYRLYHPRVYRPRTPIFWWLGRLSYTKFILRELTSIAVAYSAVLLTVQIWTLSEGAESHERFVALLGSPAMLVVNTIALLALVFHSVTWLNLAPRALVLRVAGRRVPNAAVLLGHYGAWIVATGVIAWYLLGN